jgi:hypothetical protein
MEPTPFELTPAQKGLLESLARETGRAMSSLLDEALERLQEHVHHRPSNGAPHGSDEQASPAPPQDARKPIWERFEAASHMVPEEELDRLPTDLAAQIDHYIYGTPKR